jgi:chromosome segregation ATPase
MTDPTKFMTTCARNCEARSYQITVRQQDAKILELHAYLDDIKNQLIDALSTNYELEKTNNTLHKLMVSGERRGIEKATEEFKDKIADLEHDLRISRSNKQVSDESFLELASTVVELEKELANSKESVKRNAHRIVERDEEIAELEDQLGIPRKRVHRFSKSGE